MHKLARGVYTPDKPLGWLLRAKTQDQVKPRFYLTKPKKYNAEYFELVLAYEVVAD